MNPREIREIEEADELLKSAEATFPSAESARQFEEAFQILNDYLEFENPAQSTRVFISNVKVSYTRTVLTHLKEIETNEFDTYVHYLILLLLRMKAEFEGLSVSHAELGRMYSDSIQRFKPQLKELVQYLRRDLT